MIEKLYDKAFSRFCVETRPYNNTCQFSTQNGAITPHNVTHNFRIYQCCGTHANMALFCEPTNEMDVSVLTNNTQNLDELQHKINEDIARLSTKLENERSSSTEEVARYVSGISQRIDSKKDDLRKKKSSNRAFFMFYEEYYDAFSNEIKENLSNFRSATEDRMAEFNSDVSAEIKLLERDLTRYNTILKALSKGKDDFEYIRQIAVGYGNFLDTSHSKGKSLYRETTTFSREVVDASIRLIAEMEQKLLDGRKEFCPTDEEISKFINATAKRELGQVVSSLEELVSKELESNIKSLGENISFATSQATFMLGNFTYSTQNFLEDTNIFAMRKQYQEISELHRRVSDAYGNTTHTQSVIGEIITKTHDIVSKSSAILNENVTNLLQELKGMNNAILDKIEKIDIESDNPDNDDDDVMVKRRNYLKRCYDVNYAFYVDSANRAKHQKSIIEYSHDKLTDRQKSQIDYANLYQKSEETFSKITKLLERHEEKFAWNPLREAIDFVEHKCPDFFNQLLGPKLREEDRRIRLIAISVSMILILVLYTVVLISTLLTLEMFFPYPPTYTQKVIEATRDVASITFPYTNLLD